MGHQIIVCSICGAYVMEGSNAWECDCGARCSWDTGYKWHQFSLVENPDVVWCEVTTSDLSMIEESGSDLLACKNKCAVTDSDGKNCPETPMTSLIVNGKELMLCYRCFLNVSNGMYNKKYVS
jgi:predicted metal-binding protein